LGVPHTSMFRNKIRKNYSGEKKNGKGNCKLSKEKKKKLAKKWRKKKESVGSI